MAWYVLAVERALGLPSASVDKSHMETCLSQLTHSLAGQVEYHKINAARCYRIQERLHRWGTRLLALTLICCGLHFIPTFCHGLRLPEWFLALLTFLCGFLPALGAALAGIFNQGEFRRIAKRSDAMQEPLQKLLKKIEDRRKEIAAMPGQPTKQLSPQIAALAGDAARLLINEVLDWRVVFLDQPLIPPA